MVPWCVSCINDTGPTHLTPDNTKPPCEFVHTGVFLVGWKVSLVLAA